MLFKIFRFLAPLIYSVRTALLTLVIAVTYWALTIFQGFKSINSFDPQSNYIKKEVIVSMTILILQMRCREIK